MSQAQKQAWFTLIVIASTFAAVSVLYPFLGRAAAGGFGLFGFLGLGPLFYRRHRGQLVTDERDQIILQRSTLLAYSIFWVAFVASAMLTLAVYGFDGAVPVPVVMNALFCAMLLFAGTHAIATLVQYGKGGVDARS